MMNYTMEPRTLGYIDLKNYVKSGDMFGVIRLDGLGKPFE